MNTQTDALVSCMNCTASSLPHCSAMGDSVEMAAVDVARLYCGLNRYFRYRCFLLRGDCLHTYIDTKLVKVWRIRKFLQRIAAYQTVKGKEATRFLKMSI